MHPVQVLVTPTGGHLEVLVRHVQAVQEREPDKKILLVTSTSPYKDIHKAFLDAGVGDVMVLDLLSTMMGVAPEDRPSDAVFIPSPTMLEMTAMRVEQVHRRLGGDVHVIVDTLDSLAVYSSRKAVEEFTHYLVNRLRYLHASGDLVVTDNMEGQALREAARPYTDGTTIIEGA